MKISRVTAMLSNLECISNIISYTERLCRVAIKEFPEDQDLRIAEDCLDNVDVSVAGAEEHLERFLKKLEEEKLRSMEKS